MAKARCGRCCATRCTGRIFVPAYKNEEVIVVTAKHEPLVSGALFDDVQDILNGRIRTLENKITEMTVMDSHLKEQLEFCCELLPNLVKYYAKRICGRNRR